MESPSTDDASDQGVPWQSFYDEARERCTAAGLPHPDIDARRIVEEAAGFEPSEFRTSLRQLATQRGVVRFDRMMTRRLTGEPLQYVLGSWGFRTLDLMVDHRALIPRPETEGLVDLGLAELARLAVSADGPLRALDLGTGTGAIGLSLLAERTDVHAVLTDASEDAVALARSNMAGLGRPAARGEIRHGSWFEALSPAERHSFHLIISNPPYVATIDELPSVVADWEPADALFSGADGFDDARLLLAGAGEWLVPGGALVLELGATQLTEAASLAEATGWVDISIHQDLAGRDRSLVARQPHHDNGGAR